MAEIQEYLPQVQAPEPVGGTSPNIELAGAVGRGMENLGESFSQAGQLIHRRQAQEESADVYEHTAMMRENLIDQIQKGTLDGSLNGDQIKDKLDKAYDGFEENISTPEAKNYLERQKARLRGYVLGKLSTSEGVVAFNDAQQSFTNSLNATSASVYKDPMSFATSRESLVEHAFQILPHNERARNKMIQQADQELSKQAVLGMAESNPQAALHMLDQGGFDDYLNGDQKRILRSEVNNTQDRKDISFERHLRVEKEMQQANFNKYMNSVSDKLESNQLTPDDVQEAFHNKTIDWRQRSDMLDWIKQRQKQEVINDPHKEIEVYQRMLMPDHPNPITNPYQIFQEMGHGLSPEAATKAAKMMENGDVMSMRSSMSMALEQGLAKSVYTNPMTGAQQGYEQAQQYMNDLIYHTMNPDKTGIPISSLLNPTSNDWFGNRAPFYQNTWQDQIGDVHQDRVNKALGIRPSAENQTGERPEMAYRPDEANDPQKFLDRINKQAGAKQDVEAPPPPPAHMVPTAAPGARPADPEAAPIDPKDDLGYLLDSIGVFGPETKKKREEEEIRQREERKRTRDYFNRK